MTVEEEEEEEEGEEEKKEEERTGEQNGSLETCSKPL